MSHGLMCPKELMAEPHTMLLMLNSRWEYAYTPNGEALALQTFMLTEPAIYCLEVMGVGSWGVYLDVEKEVEGSKVIGSVGCYTPKIPPLYKVGVITCYNPFIKQQMIVEDSSKYIALQRLQLYPMVFFRSGGGRCV